MGTYLENGMHNKTNNIGYGYCMEYGTTIGQTNKTMCKTYGDPRKTSHTWYFFTASLLSNLSRSCVYCGGIAPKVPFHLDLMMVSPKDLHNWAWPRLCKPQFTIILGTQFPSGVYYFWVLPHYLCISSDIDGPKAIRRKCPSWGGKGRTAALDVALCFVGRHRSHVHGLWSLQVGFLENPRWKARKEKPRLPLDTTQRLSGHMTSDAEMTWH